MSPLRAVTPRGVGLLCAGVAVLIGGAVVGERDLVGLGALLIGARLLSALTLAGALRGLTVQRRVHPLRLPVGAEAAVGLRVAKPRGILPAGGLVVEDTVPAALGPPPRFAVGLLGAGASRDLAYRVRPTERGAYPLGPALVTAADPLGCSRPTRAAGHSTVLLVTPRVVALSGPGAQGGTAAAGALPDRDPAASGEDDPVPRPYQSGDELRKVHWRSTARHGRLMVRRSEARRDGTTAVLLDLRTAAHRGSGPHSTLEAAVAAAASIALHLASSQGRRVRLFTGEGELEPAGPGPWGAVEALATAASSGRTSLAPGAALLDEAARSGAPAIAVLGALSAADLASLERVSGGLRTAFLCTAGTAQDASAAALSATGWRTAAVPSLDALPSAWQTAGTGVPGGVR
ncbi:DUF58 domain-containing protein [Nocardiopsis coralliicola]